MKKPYVCMKMERAMKMKKNARTILKKPAAMKILKKPSGTASDVSRTQNSRRVKHEGKIHKAKENACARARKAARSKKSYEPRDP